MQEGKPFCMKKLSLRSAQGVFCDVHAAKTNRTLFAPLRRRFFRGCCGALLSRAARRGLASPALLVRLAFGCGFPRTLTAALLPRGLFAPSAHLLFSEKVSCKASRKAQHIVSAIHLIYHIQANSAKLEFCRIICGFRQ